ncbi:MAG: hypothetical protein GY842_00710 [bacterium]|nr:hypothetical protein [bacterium]
MTPTTIAIVYLLFALGGVAVYFALPGGPRSARMAGLLFGVAAILGFVILAVGRILPEGEPKVAFAVFAAAAVFGAGKVITHSKPVYSAIYFVLVVLSVASLLVLQQAEFLGIALVIVYAGAILVTYVFVIMLAQQSGASETDTRAREPFTAVLVGFATMAAVAGQAGQLSEHGEAPLALERAGHAVVVADGDAGAEMLKGGNTAQVGFELLSRYVVALEIAGVLLLVAMVGAIALAKKRVPTDVPLPETPSLGQIGRDVAPF